MIVLKFLGKYRGPKIDKNIFEKHKIERLILSVFKPYFKASVIEMVWYTGKGRPKEQKRMVRNRPIHIWTTDF